MHPIIQGFSQTWFNAIMEIDDANLMNILQITI